MRLFCLQVSVSAVDPITGVVLAGGRSSRMGSDKALLTLRGRRLVDHAVDVLHACCDQVLVASGDDRRLDALDVRQVADAVSGAGPLGGILAGLEQARHPLVAVLAVDLPRASPDVFRLLARRGTASPVVAPRVDGRLQPLHAIWATASAPALRDLLDAGIRSVVAAAEALGVDAIDAEECAAVTGGVAFASNLNRIEDLEELQMDEWLERYAAALRTHSATADPEIDPATCSVLLDLARLVAHGTQRRNAPLATYVAGRYVSARVAEGTDARQALAEAVEVARSLLGPAE